MKNQRDSKATENNVVNRLTCFRAQITYLCKNHPNVHIDLSVAKSRKKLVNVPAVITSVYPNIFFATLDEDGIKRNYTFQYADLLTGNLIVRELDNLVEA